MNTAQGTSSRHTSILQGKSQVVRKSAHLHIIMCCFLSEFFCPGCARQFAPTFQRCPDSYQPWHYVSSLRLVDLIRTNSYCCPYPGCDLNGNVHHALFNIQVDATTQNESFHQSGFMFLPLNAYDASGEEDEPCEMALSTSEAEEFDPCELALSDDDASQPRTTGKSSFKSVRFAPRIKDYQKGSKPSLTKPLRDGPGRSKRTAGAGYQRITPHGRISKRS